MSVARATVQDRGYNGLSFRELAKDVGIKSASIHYYFPSKGDLGGAVAAQYTSDFERISTGCWPILSIRMPASGNTPTSSGTRC